MKMLYHSLNLKFPAGDPRAKDARIIDEKIEHLNKIVEQILGFARTTEPDRRPVNLNELVDELGLLVRHKLKNQNIQLVRRLQPAHQLDVLIFQLVPHEQPQLVHQLVQVHRPPVWFSRARETQNLLHDFIQVLDFFINDAGIFGPGITRGKFQVQRVIQHLHHLKRIATFGDEDAVSLFNLKVHNTFSVMKFLYHSLNLKFPAGDPREISSSASDTASS